MCKPKGGAREGAGRKPKLTVVQVLWIQNRVKQLMFECKKDLALHRDMPINRIAGDLSELREIQQEMRNLPVSMRRTPFARELQVIASEMIYHRIIRIGSGTGPKPRHLKEKSAAQIREQVAREANKKFKRKDITPRMVQTACATKLFDD